MIKLLDEYVHYAHNGGFMKYLTNNATSYAGILTRLGGGIARYSVAAIFLAYGIFKFTEVEANAIAPLTENSPFLFWLNQLLGRQGGSNLIGIMEIIIAAMIAARSFSPVVSALGSLAAAGALSVTLSFLFSTPGLSPLSVDAGFLVKDLTLLGASLWAAGEALGAVRAGTARQQIQPA